MTRASITKTSFTSGELDPLLQGRLDLKAQEDGAAKLRNVVVHPTGGVSRRPGLRFVAAAPGALRLLAFEGPDGGELLALGDHRLDVIKDGAVVWSAEDTLWSAAETVDLSAARWGGRLLLCHPDAPPKELIRNGVSGWALRDWAYEEALGGSGYRRELQPFARFARLEIALQVNNGTEEAIAAGTYVDVVTSEPVFTADHIDAVVRVKGRDIRIANPDPVNRQLARGVALERLENGLPTRDWAEQAFGQARGWPACVAVYQERLVVGGSRDLPDRLWFSRTGHPFNFDPGEGLDDEAFSFRLVGNEQHDIRSLVAGRQLQVFTGGGEWIVRGAKVTPETVEVELQTRVGSWGQRRLDPVDVDGATLFVGASGRELREFLYAESEQAYQAADVALLSRHLLDDPVAMRFDRLRRWLLIVRGDGQLASVSIDRNSNVVAWSLLHAAGAFRSVAVHGGEPHFLVNLGGLVAIERFDDGLMTDHAVTLARPEPTSVWNGLDHLEGQAVIVQHGLSATRATVASGTVTFPEPATSVTVGVPYAHEVEPLPLVVPDGSGISLDRPYRPVRVVFRLLTTGALRADTGAGLRALDLGSPGGAGSFTGDVGVRALGWRRGLERPPWRVSQDDPVPCTILSVTSEIKGNA
jgi:hypothetical protein